MIPNVIEKKSFTIFMDLEYIQNVYQTNKSC